MAAVRAALRGYPAVSGCTRHLYGGTRAAVRVSSTLHALAAAAPSWACRRVGTSTAAVAQGSGAGSGGGTASTMHLTVDDIMARAAEQQKQQQGIAAATQAPAETTDQLPGAADKGVRRFYKTVGVRGVDATGAEVETDEAPFFEVLIDGKPMKTIARNPLQLPSLGLAMAVASEMAVQQDVIMPSSLPLFNLASAAADHYPEQEESLKNRVVEFLETDTVCYRVTDFGDDARDTLCLKRQEKHYAPLIEWFEQRFGGPLEVVDGIGIPEHPEEVLQRVLDEIHKRDYYFFAALDSALGITKSTVIAMALLYRRISVDQAFDAARVEEEHQIDQHGFVYDGHDTARVHAKVKLAAASALLWHLPSSQPEDLPAKFDAGGAAVDTEE